MKKLVGSFSDNGMQTVPEHVALEEMRGNIVVPGRSAVKRSTNRRAETFGKTLEYVQRQFPHGFLQWLVLQRLPDPQK
jgi:hypothetical protein